MRHAIIEDVTDVPIRDLYDANIEVISVWPRVNAVIGYVEKVRP